MKRHDPQPIGDIILQMAADPNEPYSKILRQCPFIQNEFLKQGKMTEDEIRECQSQRTQNGDILGTLLDGHNVMMKLHISPRTLQTLRSNGTIPYTRIGRKIYYFRHDIERLLKDNYVVFNIRERYGKDDK